VARFPLFIQRFKPRPVMGKEGKRYRALVAVQMTQLVTPVPIRSLSAERPCPEKQMCPLVKASIARRASHYNYFTMRGGSLKNIAKKIIPKVPTNKNV